MRKRKTSREVAAEQHNDQSEPSTGNAVRAAVSDDSELLRRVLTAQFNGWVAPSLEGVSLHRRAAVVEDALVAWETRMAGSPCDACGTLEPRRGYNRNEYEGTPPEPRFTQTSIDGRVLSLCDWCREYVEEPGHGLDGLKYLVFKATAALHSTNGDNFGIRLFTDYPGAVAGEPWGYVDRSLARKLAVERGIPAGSMVRAGTPPCHAAQVIGIERYQWSPDELPREATWFRVKKDQVQVMEPADVRKLEKAVAR